MRIKVNENFRCPGRLEIEFPGRTGRDGYVFWTSFNKLGQVLKSGWIQGTDSPLLSDEEFKERVYSNEQVKKFAHKNGK